MRVDMVRDFLEYGLKLCYGLVAKPVFEKDLRLRELLPDDLGGARVDDFLFTALVLQGGKQGCGLALGLRFRPGGRQFAVGRCQGQSHVRLGQFEILHLDFDFQFTGGVGLGLDLGLASGLFICRLFGLFDRGGFRRIYTELPQPFEMTCVVRIELDDFGQGFPRGLWLVLLFRGSRQRRERADEIGRGSGPPEDFAET